MTTHAYHYNAASKLSQKCRKPENCQVTTIHRWAQSDSLVPTIVLADAYQEAENAYQEALETNFQGVSITEMEQMLLRYTYETQSARKHYKMYEKQIIRLWESEGYYASEKGRRLTQQRDHAQRLVIEGEKAMKVLENGIGDKRNADV